MQQTFTGNFTEQTSSLIARLAVGVNFRFVAVVWLTWGIAPPFANSQQVDQRVIEHVPLVSQGAESAVKAATEALHFTEALQLIGTTAVYPVMAGILQAGTEVRSNPQQDSSTNDDDGDDGDGDRPPVDRSISELADFVKRSLVVIRPAGRDGQDIGLGTGFVIASNGLIATARHCIEEGHDIRVETEGGKSLSVTHVYSQLEALDLVILKVDAEGLIPLPLGDSDNVIAGQSVVAVGHPQGLRNTVFDGIVSGREEIEGLPFLKLSMKVERGSSGEPVVDRQGNVVALVTLKSTQMDSVGFAVPVNDLKRLLEDPSPISIERWKTIGALDKGRWETVWGANWRQRAGRILVDGVGTSFGGRSLCLQTADVPEIPFEIQVEVKLGDESGAAGLVFYSDGDERHYGFYPSNGNVRLTRFNGPYIGSWMILHNEPHPAYRSGGWNTFKVRVEKNRFVFFLNEQQVTSSIDDVLKPGQVGLATFRGTAAEFRRFQVAKEIPSRWPGGEDAKTISSVVQAVTAVRPADQSQIEKLRSLARYSSVVLEAEAEELEKRAIQLKRLAVDVHSANIREQIISALQVGVAESTDKSRQSPDLLLAALLVAKLDNDEVEPDSYMELVDNMANEIRSSFPQNATELQRLESLNQMMFQELGFHGAVFEYNTRSSSYLNEVIDDREGLPIALSVLYIEVAKRLDLKVVGVGLPGHFVVRFEPNSDETPNQTIDVFNKGKLLSQDDVRRLVAGRGYSMRREFVEAQTPLQIIQRMVTNLLALAELSRDDDRVLRYLELLVALDENDFQHRAKRMEIRSRTGRLAEALVDLDWFMTQPDEAINKDALQELRSELEQQQEQQLKKSR